MLGWNSGGRSTHGNWPGPKPDVFTLAAATQLEYDPPPPKRPFGRSIVTFLRTEASGPANTQALAFFKANFGFVPNLFRAQGLRDDLVQAEANLVGSVLLRQGGLSRFQKECILLVISAANSNTYSVALHGQLLEILGISREQSEQIAIDHQSSTLAEPDKVLLDVVEKLAKNPSAFSEADIELLRRHGFTEEQILESILMTGLTTFLNTVQIGLGAVPDFPPRVVFPLKEVNLPSESSRPTIEQPLQEEVLWEDPDAEIVARVQAGETDAFEELVRKHGRRIYRSLVGILGSADEAEDAMQDAFMKAFQHIGDFQRRSRFSTWLVRIAINTAIQRVRGRKEIGSLEDDEDGQFKPRNIQAWQDDPEQCCSKEEMRRLVEKEIMKLPAKYRLVLILRDVEELSTAEAANALGLGVPALKARLVRGRLMLRESLVPYFSKEHTGVTV
jgi:RNA polymerase sigma-70 factor (ECF subfamily)